MAKEVHKLQRLKAGDEDPHIQELIKNFNLLANAHNDLVRQTNANSQRYNDIMQHMDVRIGAAFSAIQDLADTVADSMEFGVVQMKVMRTLVVIDDKPTMRVDWPRYLQNHIDTVKLEIARMTAAQAEAVVPDESPLITPPGAEESDALEEEPDSVFGGDHGEAQQQLPAT